MNCKSRNVLFLTVSALAMLLALLVTGCGGEAATTVTTSGCDFDQPSKIPPPSGKGQFVYFYRDT